MKSRTIRLLLLCGLISTFLAPAPVSANHIAGAIYVGRVEGGGRVEIRISGTGGKIVEFVATNVSGDPCGFRQILRAGITIADHAFSVSGLSGTFSSSGKANGTLRARTSECDTGSRSWSASRTPVRELTVTKTGTGGGTVTSNDPGNIGISCGHDCTEDFPRGTRVVLKADPNSTSKFAGWSGACSGTGRCSVTMGSDKTVRARFVAVRRLTVFVDGTGTGTVTSSPTGISCPTVCTKRFPEGTTVDLAASPAPGSVFAGWIGACSGTGACSISMDSQEKVIATFDPESGGGGGGNADYQGFWTGTTAQGFDVALTILEGSAYEIVELTLGWSTEDCELRLKNSRLSPALQIEPNGTFSNTINAGGTRFTFAGSFASDTEVSGTIDVEGEGDCEGVSTTWSATKEP